MNFSASKQRIYSSLLILGSCILLFRAITMLSEGSLGVLVAWVSFLLIAEMMIDASCLFSSAWWWITDDRNNARIPLYTGVIAAILHAIRVLIFVLGRIGPWIDFDVRPEHRVLHHTRWSRGGLYFAAIMSVLGVVGVLIIWRLRRRTQKKRDKLTRL